MLLAAVNLLLRFSGESRINRDHITINIHIHSVSMDETEVSAIGLEMCVVLTSSLGAELQIAIAKK